MKEETKKIIERWADAQNKGAYLPCPRCGSVHLMRERMIENALSRRAMIYICSVCGTDETLEDMIAAHHDDSYKLSPDNWFVVRTVYGQHDHPFSQSDGRWLVTAQKSVYISAEDVDDIMTAALKGGITYWCRDAEPVNGFLGNCDAEQISRGGILRLYDNATSEVYELDLEKLLRGIRLWIENETDSDGVVCGEELDYCNVDASVADSMIQYAIFGEVIFA